MIDPTLHNYIENIEDHLKTAAAIAQHMRDHVFQTEGDTDLFRKLSYYTVPSLNHWIDGAQAGSIKDMKETLARRVDKVTEPVVQSTDTNKVLTKSKKKKK